MIVHLLGTGAAEGIPAFFSNTEVSRYARAHGGKDIRSRSAALIDDCIKIDIGPDTVMQMNRDGLDAVNWTAILVTHSDCDHFAPAELRYALHPFSDKVYADFVVYANEEIVAQIEAMYPDWPFEAVTTRSFQPFTHAGYTITPVAANHMTTEDCQNFVISDGEKTVLYATDTGVWQKPTWDALEHHRLNGMIIECTEGFRPTNYFGHLDIRECIAVVDALRDQGTLLDDAVVCTTHHSHNGGATHGQLEKVLSPHGILVGYDGLTLEI